MMTPSDKHANVSILLVVLQYRAMECLECYGTLRSQAVASFHAINAHFSTALDSASAMAILQRNYATISRAQTNLVAFVSEIQRERRRIKEFVANYPVPLLYLRKLADQPEGNNRIAVKDFVTNVVQATNNFELQCVLAKTQFDMLVSQGFIRMFQTM